MTVNTVIFTGFILRSEQLKNTFADCKIRTELVLTCNISHIVNTQILRIHTSTMNLWDKMSLLCLK